MSRDRTEKKEKKAKSEACDHEGGSGQRDGNHIKQRSVNKVEESQDFSTKRTAFDGIQNGEPDLNIVIQKVRSLDRSIRTLSLSWTTALLVTTLRRFSIAWRCRRSSSR